MAKVPENLCDLAADCLSAAQDVTDAWSREQTTFAVPPGAAGNTSSGVSLLNAHTGVTESAALFMGRLSGVLEQDMDDIYGCAFTWSSADEEAARNAESSYPLPPEPSPGPSPEPFPEDGPHPQPDPQPDPRPDPQPEPEPKPTGPSELPTPANHPRRS
ncbi:hypothetical protein ncot_10055 [Nocardioides sp. JQ2195]|uniref:hypothetical protein n=1 Tax=Nocardioides sp. JQ2195 TaxID=2592334 RepID=UPI00143E1437|nr:hypothetical protein [Nocardioides sp. JQ2195]QIX26911.1 hypothetical protein ncot_10055 [Nocardioides sp. JQ2195]